MKERHSGAWIALLLLAIAAAARADERDFSGVVIRVFDGDSFVVRAAAGAKAARVDIEVRLTDIDAPEKDQPYADIARGALAQLIEGRRVFVDVIDIDRYARKVAKVYREPDRLEIVRVLVQQGHVWVNRKYAQDRTLTTLENDARSRREGLWSLPSADLIPPWRFRQLQKEMHRQRTTQN